MLTLIFSASSALFTEKHGGWVSLVPALAVFDFRVVYPAHQTSLAAIPPDLRCAALPAGSLERLRAFPSPVFCSTCTPGAYFPEALAQYAQPPGPLPLRAFLPSRTSPEASRRATGSRLASSRAAAIRPP